MIKRELSELNFNMTEIALADVEGSELILTKELDNAEVRRVEEFRNKVAIDIEIRKLLS